MAKELFDFAAEKIHETEKAILLDDGTKKFWLPKEAVQDNEDGTWTVSMYWAKEKELI